MSEDESAASSDSEECGETLGSDSGRSIDDASYESDFVISDNDEDKSDCDDSDDSNDSVLSVCSSTVSPLALGRLQRHRGAVFRRIVVSEESDSE